MTLGIILKIAGLVLPILLGPIVYVVARQALNIHDAVDGLPPIAKRVIVTILGAAIVVAFNALGLTLPSECISDPSAAECATALSAPAMLKGITGAVVAMIMHKFLKADPRRA